MGGGVRWASISKCQNTYVVVAGWGGGASSISRYGQSSFRQTRRTWSRSSLYHVGAATERSVGMQWASANDASSRIFTDNEGL